MRAGTSGDFFTKPRLGVIILTLFGGDGSAHLEEGIPARILGGWGFDRGRTWDRFAASLQTSKSENPYAHFSTTLVRRRMTNVSPGTHGVSPGTQVPFFGGGLFTPPILQPVCTR